MKSQDIRNRFVDYFKRHGHTPVTSSSLIPENDPTLLFANAGMNQFKNTFLGLEKRDYVRAVSVQKCVRAGGKHNDLENVGFTARHHTFFEMLGNFSFGDYFKKEAIHFAWEFLTKELGLPQDKLYITVFEKDDEAAHIWQTQEKIPSQRIFRFGEKDNFWRMGDTGPCGPCSEIFYDHGPGAGKESDPYKGIAAGEDRFVEIWNLVFMQFFEKSPGVMEPLPKPSVDTGSGLERVVAAMQGVTSNFDTDLFLPMIERGASIAGIRNLTQLRGQPETLGALRVLADHARASAFLLADGALPSNEGRGYVLRRILRRALRYGRKISPDQSVLPSVVEVLIQAMTSTYPELTQRSKHILSTVKDEEGRFFQTLDMGTTIFNEALAKIRGEKIIPAELIFKLYDTFGFPMDLTNLMAKEQGFQLDEKGYENLMDQAREKAKSSWKGKGISSNEAQLLALVQEVANAEGSVDTNGKPQAAKTNQNKTTFKTQFIGYDTLEGTARVLGLSPLESGQGSADGGPRCVVILDRTPFYAEGGGQAGDTGILIFGGDKTHVGVKARVLDTTKINDIYLHHCEFSRELSETQTDATGNVGKIPLKVGDVVTAQVANSERRATMNNHSATHLLQSALRKVLGNHVAQAGSLVDSAKLRFDFTHSKAMTEKEIKEVEDLVNHEIALAQPVNCQVKSHKEALAQGALALFGEKYGDQVRVVQMGDFSTELCGGTHVANTSYIRVFKVMGESGVSSGVRRIEGITGEAALSFLTKAAEESFAVRASLGIQSGWMNHFDNPIKPNEQIEKIKSQVRALEKEIRQLKGGQINIIDILKAKKTVTTGGGLAISYVMADLEVDEKDLVVQAVDKLKEGLGSGIVLAIGTRGNENEGVCPLAVSVSKDLSAKFSAGNILKNFATVMGGRGGGRPDFAQGSVPSKDKLADAIVAFEKMIREL